MINIKRFVAKVSSMDSKQGKAVVLSMDEARQLRDELVSLLADNLELSRKTPDQITTVEIIGGKF
jgi:hypothetical protein